MSLCISPSRFVDFSAKPYKRDRKGQISMSNSLILYIGKPEAGQTFAAAAEAHGHYAYLPENLMQALGMYITYFPEIVIIDMDLDYAQDVLDHLRSVDASPLILLTDQ